MQVFTVLHYLFFIPICCCGLFIRSYFFLYMTLFQREAVEVFSLTLFFEIALFNLIEQGDCLSQISEKIHQLELQITWRDKPL